MTLPDRSDDVFMQSEPLKVLYVLHTASVTTKRFFLPLARRARERGYEVSIATGPGNGEDDFRRAGYPMWVLPIRRRLFTPDHLRALWKLYRLMQRERFHIVHTHSPIASALARVAAALAGVPVVIYHLRTSYIDQSPVAEQLFLVFEKLFAPLNSFILTLNRFDARDFTRHGIAQEDRILCLGSGGTGVNVKTFSLEAVSPAKQEDLREEIGIGSGPVIGFVGRMVEEKGILDLLEAFRSVARHHPRVQLLMVGGVLDSARDQDTFDIFKQKAAAYGLQNLIIYAGFRDDIPALLTLMDVLALPSYRETFGMTIAEAAAMGIPAVTTATRGGRQAVVDGETGRIVPVGGAEELAHALTSMLSDTERLQAMGANARQRAEQVFGEEPVVERQLAVYERLLREKGFL